MDIQSKLAILADAAKYDASCASSAAPKRSSRGGSGVGSTTGMGICHAYAPDGRCISLLKILLTNFCIFECAYCINRNSSSVRRARFSVDEVVDLTLAFYKRNYIEGLFLSSGIIQSPDYTMEQVVEVARRLRMNHDFRGYIHLKTIPDADPDLLRAAGVYADRLSINVELPTPTTLQRLAPEKSMPRIEASMGAMRERITEAKAERRKSRKAPHFSPSGQSTQMIIGADDTSDAQIIDRAASLYSGYKLKRVYYSAFSPIPDASSELPPQQPPLAREHRLYQSDWLVRFYGFAADEIPPPGGMLDLDIDPKLAWALRHREQFPVDLNRAPREKILRVPGLGTKSVAKILRIRKFRKLRSDDIAKLRVPTAKVLPFVILADHTPHRAKLEPADLRARLAPPPAQHDLFASA